MQQTRKSVVSRNLRRTRESEQLPCRNASFRGWSKRVVAETEVEDVLNVSATFRNVSRAWTDASQQTNRLYSARRADRQCDWPARDVTLADEAATRSDRHASNSYQEPTWKLAEITTHLAQPRLAVRLHLRATEGELLSGERPAHQC